MSDVDHGIKLLPPNKPFTEQSFGSERGHS
jgi:hypothetical protein